MAEEKKEITWQAEEYVFHEKTVDWYWYFGLITIILVASALYLHNTLFAFIIGIGAFIMLSYANKHPQKINYTADDKKIYFDNKSYIYREIDSFWIIDDKKKSSEKLLLLEPKKTVSTVIVIPLGEVAIDEIRPFLLDFIEEKEMPIPMGHTLMEVIGF